MTHKKRIFIAIVITIAIAIPSLSFSYPVTKENAKVNTKSIKYRPPIIDILLGRLSPKPKYRHIDDKSTHYKSDVFPIPSALRPRIDFWKNIYTTYTTKQVVIHSSINPHIIYKVINITDKNGNPRLYRSRSVQRELNREKRIFRNILKSIHYKNKKQKRLTKAERKIASLFSRAKEKANFLDESRSVRAQLGQSDRFAEGIRRSGRYINKMQEIFKEEGLPSELTALPHVESSFNYKAYSSAGAMGIWQFMRSTGKQFMKINYVIDERCDPVTATRGAAKLLKKNYKALGNWPLAITAYNHGLSGIKRAKKKVGPDIIDVIDNYRSRYFGFASKNFYSEFMAAVEIMHDPSKYFGQIELYPPIEYQTIDINRYVSINTLSKHLSLSKRDIALYNPALRTPVVEGLKHIPRGYTLNVPKVNNVDYVQLYKSIPRSKQYTKQKPSEWYRVRRGDTLSVMARRFRTSVSSLMAMNDLDSVHRIYAGQILRVTGSKHPKTSRKRLTTISKPSRNIKNDIIARQKTKGIKVAEVRERFSSKLYEFLSPATANAKNLSYGYIRIEPEETLGHYSEWCGVSAGTLRRLNGIRSRRYPIVIGKKIKIPFTSVPKEAFEEKRAEYHLALQEDYFSSYQVKETLNYQMKSGDTIWSISTKDDIPIWLLKWYNPEKNLHTIKVGDKLTIPLVSVRETTPQKI